MRPLTLTALLAACATSAPDMGPGTAVIGPGGGVLEHPAVRLIVPPGALDADTTLTVSPTKRSVPHARSTVFAFDPDGLAFAVPATVELQFTDSPPVEVRWTDTRGVFQPQPTTVADDWATASIDHFSAGYVAGIVPPPGSTGDTGDTGDTDTAGIDTGGDDTGDSVPDTHIVDSGDTGPRVPPNCGDGHHDVGEACDDGNTLDEDGCDRFCRREVCGDGIVQGGLGEICDDAHDTAGPCGDWCFPLGCGDGALDAGETCDRGDGTPCDQACAYPAWQTPPPALPVDRDHVVVARHDDHWILGARFDDTHGTDAGIVTTLHWDGAVWVRANDLSAPDAADFDAFGHHLAVGDDVLAITAATSSRGNHLMIATWDGATWTPVTYETTHATSPYTSVRVTGSVVWAAWYEDPGTAQSVLHIDRWTETSPGTWAATHHTEDTPGGADATIQPSDQDDVVPVAHDRGFDLWHTTGGTTVREDVRTMVRGHRGALLQAQLRGDRVDGILDVLDLDGMPPDSTGFYVVGAHRAPLLPSGWVTAAPVEEPAGAAVFGGEHVVVIGASQLMVYRDNGYGFGSAPPTLVPAVASSWRGTAGTDVQGGILVMATGDWVRLDAGACGDGQLQAPHEACDDGDTDAGDGCDGACAVE